MYIKTGEHLPVKPEQSDFSLPVSSIFIPDWTLHDSVFHYWAASSPPLEIDVNRIPESWEKASLMDG